MTDVKYIVLEKKINIFEKYSTFVQDIRETKNKFNNYEDTKFWELNFCAIYNFFYLNQQCTIKLVL